MKTNDDYQAIQDRYDSNDERLLRNRLRNNQRQLRKLLNNNKEGK